MDKIYTFIISFCVIIAGSVLMLFGIKNLKFKKRNLFTAGLIIFLSLAGCKNGNTPKNTSAQIKQQSDINKIKALKEWHDFKILFASLMQEKSDYILTEKLNLNTIAQANKLYEAAGKDSIEIEIITDLCINKINVLNNFNRKMTMHMIPPDTIIELTFYKISASLNALEQLKSNKEIDKKQFDTALNILTSEITDFAKINFIYKYYFDKPAIFNQNEGISKETSDLVRYSVKKLEDDYIQQKENLKKIPDKTKLESLETKYSFTKDRLLKSDSVKDNIKILLSDLIK